jgi:putative PIG3 family NAD(P)H quinone oxidoreductase
MGLECAGEVEAAGEGAVLWKKDDRVCALLAGGGYAEKAVCPEGHLLPVPDAMSFEEAAALPEVLCTAWLNIFLEADARPEDRVLVHAGASGVGTAAVQLCRAMGVRCWVTAGSDEKIAFCRELGAEGGCNRHTDHFADRVASWTNGKGFDIVLDPVGGAYLEANIGALARGGRLVLIGLLGGRKSDVDLGRLLVKRLRIIGSTLRSRSNEDKERLIASIRERVWPWITSGRVRPIVHAVMPIHSAEAAHRLLETNTTTGKIVLSVPG